MRISALAFCSLFTVVSLGTAFGQAEFSGPPETVYSNAQREKDLTVSQEMVGTMLAQSFSLENQYARWKDPVCPHVYGLTPVAAWLVERRIREVAQLVGAPVNRNDPCDVNIGVYFTSQPQVSLESISAASPLLIQGGSQKRQMKFPVQAWYTSIMTDYDGAKYIDIPFDVSNPASDCILSYNPSGGGSSGTCAMPYVKANDSRLHTGLTTQMAETIVLVDSNAVMGMSLSDLSDYLAFMTLAQSSQTGVCEKFSTIANMMLKNCGDQDTPHRLSHIDIALLTALYQIPDSPEVLQKQRIVGAMRRSLEAQYGRD